MTGPCGGGLDMLYIFIIFWETPSPWGVLCLNSWCGETAGWGTIGYPPPICLRYCQGDLGIPLLPFPPAVSHTHKAVTLSMKKYLASWHVLTFPYTGDSQPLAPSSSRFFFSAFLLSFLSETPIDSNLVQVSLLPPAFIQLPAGFSIKCQMGLAPHGETW